MHFSVTRKRISPFLIIAVREESVPSGIQPSSSKLASDIVQRLLIILMFLVLIVLLISITVAGILFVLLKALPLLPCLLLFSLLLRSLLLIGYLFVDRYSLSSFPASLRIIA